MSASSTKVRASQSVAPEDLQVGEFVAVMQVSYQCPSFLWGREGMVEGRNEPVRITLYPTEDVGKPLKVLAMSLPYVIVEDKDKKTATLDLRACRLGRLDRQYVKLAWSGSKSGARSKSGGKSTSSVESRQSKKKKKRLR